MTTTYATIRNLIDRDNTQLSISDDEFRNLAWRYNAEQNSSSPGYQQSPNDFIEDITMVNGILSRMVRTTDGAIYSVSLCDAAVRITSARDTRARLDYLHEEHRFQLDGLGTIKRRLPKNRRKIEALERELANGEEDYRKRFINHGQFT